MTRLRFFMLAFCLALAVPLAYFVLRTERGLAREEEAQFRYFAETLFERMENELDQFVRQEETRAIDAYGPSPGSPALWPDQPWVVGWLQNNPDGSMRTPLATGPGQQAQMTRLTHVNTVFNDKRTVAPDVHEAQGPATDFVDAYVMELAQQDRAEEESAPEVQVGDEQSSEELAAKEQIPKEPALDQSVNDLSAQEEPTPEATEQLAPAAPEPKLQAKTKPLPEYKGKESPADLDSYGKDQVFAERYLEEDAAKKKAVLGQGKVRVEQVPQAQAMNLAPDMESSLDDKAEARADDWNPGSQAQQSAPLDIPSNAPGQTGPLFTAEDLPPESPPENMPVPMDQASPAPLDREQTPGNQMQAPNQAPSGQTSSDQDAAPQETQDGLQGPANTITTNTLTANAAPPDAVPSDAVPSDAVVVEVAPLQAVAIDDQTVFLFRRVVLDNQVFRQGVVLDLPTFLDHLVEDYFAGQPMAAFARLSLAAHNGHVDDAVHAVRGAEVDEPRLTLARAFPRPFDFLSAELTCQDIPQAAGRDTLRAMTLGLLGVMLLGMFAIHQSARVVVDHSRRRSQFVSSVTHELKTPLTNLRMYIEMLEQGIAPTPEREREYLEVLSSESARLSKLIDNVLEFSRLESRRRTLEPAEGDLTEVVEAVRRAMEGKLDQEGFTLAVEQEDGVRALYDREAMVQVLMNLMENSLKFGAMNGEKRITLRVRTDKDRVLVSLSDTGPGIPTKDLKHIFDDFYRVEAGLTRTTKGTGIGLALVRRFVRAMNGKVWAENNKGPGCTMVIALPRAA